MRDLIFLDTETTGLESNKHDIWEIAWAVNDGPVEERILVHSLKTANLESLDMNGYLRRGAGSTPRSDGPWVDLDVRRALHDATIVCANPPFDRMFMYARWGVEPYHYRSIDVESMALGILEHDRPKGLKDISEELRELDYEIDHPDHSAGRDVTVLRQCYWALRDIQKTVITPPNRPVRRES